MRLIAWATPFLLGLAVATGVQAKGGPITIRMKAVRGQIEVFYRGKKLTDSKFTQLCATSRSNKADINFQRDNMGSSDTMAAILKEADCMGAAHKGSTQVVRHPEPKSATQTHAKHQHKAKKLP